MGLLRITPQLAIDESEVAVQFIHASGPGGQNVNKVATAVQLRFDAAHSPSLPEDVRVRLLKLAGRRASAAGEIVIVARSFRTQGRNRGDALQRLLELIRRATQKPGPRHPTRPTRASVERRLAVKQKRSAAKRQRGKVLEQ
ncbi:MAG: alternative ribosome rescue aminoacyl-tRNA hydrolase ArfB [Pseudomonadota bacterium]